LPAVSTLFSLDFLIRLTCLAASSLYSSILESAYSPASSISSAVFSLCSLALFSYSFLAFAAFLLASSTDLLAAAIYSAALFSASATEPRASSSALFIFSYVSYSNASAFV